MEIKLFLLLLTPSPGRYRFMQPGPVVDWPGCGLDLDVVVECRCTFVYPVFTFQLCIYILQQHPNPIRIQANLNIYSCLQKL